MLWLPMEILQHQHLGCSRYTSNTDSKTERFHGQATNSLITRRSQTYTGEPIYFYMIGKNAGPNQVLVNENYQL